MAAAILPAVRVPSPATPRRLTPPPDATSPRSRWLWQEISFGALALVFLLLRVLYAFIQRVNSDEPQHLHVAWGWTQGGLPYRDFFDNHTPLFGGLCAPLLRALGERADIVPLMRLAMVPVYLVGLGCIYRLGRKLYTRRIGCWTALLAGLFPPFFHTATEFRTDAPWCVLWLVAILVLVNGRATPLRSFAAGLILGVALGVSLKTVLMLAALGLGAAGTLGLRAFTGREGAGWKPLFPALVSGLTGLVVVPGITAGFFAAHGAWAAMVAQTVGHNAPAVAISDHRGARALVSMLGVAAMIPAGAAVMRTGGTRGTRRTFVFLTAGFYGALLVGFWPTLTKQNFLPLYPLAAVPVVAAGWAWGARLGGGTAAGRLPRGAGWWVPGALAVLEVSVLLFLGPPWVSHVPGNVRQLNAVLRLTEPGQPVMDAKGASVFRPRPYFPVLETFTMNAITLGLRRDDIAACLVSTGTAVVIRAGLTDGAQAFVDANYLPVGSGVGAVGKRLPDPSPDGEFRFAVVVPGRYVLISRHGAIMPGSLDGEPWDGRPVLLPVGAHRFRPGAPSPADGPPVLFWAQAHERGFLPVANWSVRFTNPDWRARP